MRHGDAARHDHGGLVSDSTTRASERSWTDRVRSVYDARAGGYDLALAALPLVGFRAGAYRLAAVRALGLVPGQTVLDVGCGTGLNLPLLARAVGASGCVIGIDVSDGALARARSRTRGLSQVTLVRGDAAQVALPDADAALAAFSLSMMPNPEAVIQRLVEALRDGPSGRSARLGVLDFRIPHSWPALVQTAAFALAEPLGETWEMACRDLLPELARHATLDVDRMFYAGAAYVAAGTVL